MPAFNPPSPPPPPLQLQPYDRYFAKPSIQTTSPKLVPRRAILPLLPILPLSLLPIATQATPYDSYAKNYDTLDGSNALTKFLGFDHLRGVLLSKAYGEVLEFGIGTGQNLRYYPDKVTSLTGIDNSQEMLRLAERRSEATDFPVRLVQASVESTGLSGRFDTVVDTFSLCVYENSVKALGEMRRLVKPTGQVLLLEHSIGEGVIGMYQDATARVVKSLSKGCSPNQRVLNMVQEAGFDVIECTRILGGTVVALRLTLV